MLWMFYMFVTKQIAINVYSQFWLFSWQFPLFRTFSRLLVKFGMLFSQKWVFLFCSISGLRGQSKYSDPARRPWDQRLFYSLMSAHPTVQIHTYVSPVIMTCPGCTLSQPTVEALWVYSVYKVTGLGISKKKKEWVELRSSSKRFVTLRVCARRPSDQLQRMVYSFSFITFHKSHVYIRFVSMHSDGSVALYCLIWVRFWVTFHRLLITGCWNCDHSSWQRWCNWVSAVGVCSARSFSSLHTFSFQFVVRAFWGQLHYVAIVVLETFCKNS